MMVQYSKFVKMGRETTWRQPVGSLNYIETSTRTRQEHNGFSHQNPAFIGKSLRTGRSPPSRTSLSDLSTPGSVLNLRPEAARVYLPPDANCFLSTVAHCLRAKNYVNLMVGSKQPTPVWLSPEEADKVSFHEEYAYQFSLNLMFTALYRWCIDLEIRQRRGWC